MERQDAMAFAIETAKRCGAQQCDVLFQQSSSEDIEVFQGNITKAEASSSAGLGCRLFVDGRPGFSYTQRVTKASIEQMVKDAVDQSKFSSPLSFELPSSLATESFKDLKKWNDELEQLEMASLVEASLRMEQMAREGHAEIENVPHAGVSKGSSASALMNHHGLFYQTRSNSVSGYVSAVAQRGEQKKSAGFGNGGRSWDCVDPEGFAKLATDRAVELLGAAPMPSGKCPIVFSNRISSSLLGMFLGSLSAEQVQKGQSRFADQLGSQVASEAVTLRCEPHLVGAPGSRWVDSEGVATQPLCLIDHGQLHAYLYNLESAAVEGVAPTGNGSRGLRGRAGVSFSNLLMDLGVDSTQELLAQPESCLYVTKLEGGAACSAVSGELSIGVQGFWVESGKIVRPVDAVTVNGNFFDVLKGIQAVSKDISPIFSSYQIPDLLVEGLQISG